MRARTLVFSSFAALLLVPTSVSLTPQAQADEAPYEVHGSALPRQQSGSAAGRPHEVGGRSNTTVPPSQRGLYPTLHVPDRSPGAKRTPTAGKAAARVPFDPSRATEVTALRGRHQRVFANPDGTQTTAFSQTPVHYRAANGTWEPVRPELRPGTSGWQSSGDSVTSTLPADLATSGPRVDLGGGAAVSWRLVGAGARKGALRGGSSTGSAEVTYPGVARSTDLSLRPIPGGVKETIVLRDRTAPRVFDFELDTRGVTPRLVRGTVELVDASGTVRGSMPPGFMTETASGTDPAETSSGVRYELRRHGARSLLRVTLDVAWLLAEGRRFPVLVDPDVIQSEGTSAISVREGSAVPGGNELYVGAQGGNSSAAYVSFKDVSTQLRYHRIFGAQLSVVNFSAPSCSPRPMTVHAVTGAWSASDTSLRYPGPAFTSKPLASQSMAYGYVPFGSSSSPCAPRATAYDLGAAGRDLVQGWVNDPTQNRGLTLRGSTSDSQAWKVLTGTSTQNPPTMYVTHSPYNATYRIPSPVPNPPVMQNADGKVKIQVTNTSAMAWDSASYYLAYTAYSAQTNKVVAQNRAANLSGSVARGSTVTLDAVIKAMPAGSYIVDFTMMRTGGISFTAQSVPPARLVIQVFNTPPVLKGVYPANGYESPTLTPTLWGEATDLDAPRAGMTYAFKICEVDDAGIPSGCTTSAYQTAFSYQVPAGRLVWNKTYQWTALVKDSNAAVTTGPAVTLLANVPQPALTTAAATSQGKQYDHVSGAFSTAATDAPVTTVGHGLTVERTYNSHDARTTNAFGAGWSSRYDMRVQAESTGNLLVTLQDGSAVRFGRNADGTFAPPRGQKLSLVASTVNGVLTGYTLKDLSGTTYTFGSTGLLTTAKPALGAATTYTWAGGVLTKAYNSISKRSLVLTWTNGHVTKVSTDPVGGTPLSWTYTYSGHSLTSVCGPDANCVRYAVAPGSLYRTGVSTSRPESHWRLGETEGTTAHSDVAVNLGKDAATYVGATLGAGSSMAGSPDRSVMLGGQNTSVALPKGVVRKNRELSVELWFKTSTQGLAAPLLGYQDKALGTTSTSGVPVLYVGSDGKLRGQFRTPAAPAPVTSVARVDDQVWHHAVLTSSGSTQTLYLDGAVVGSTTGAPDHHLLGFNQLGAAYATGTWPAYGTGQKHLNGWLDEAAVYAKPLTAAEIKSHFDLGRTAVNQVTEVTLPSGRTNAEVRYDAGTNRVVEYTDQQGGTWKISPPAVTGSDTDLRRTVSVSDPANRASFFEYDALSGQLLRSGQPTGSSVRPEDRPVTPSPSSTQSELCSTPDPGDPRFCVIIGGNVDPVFVLVPLEGVAVRSYFYDAQGRMSKVVNENGAWVDLTYDSRGNVSSEKSCRDIQRTDCSTTWTTYGSGFTDPLDPRWDKPVEKRDGRSSGPADNTYLTRYAYTAQGMLQSQTAADAGVTSTTYSTGAEVAWGGGNVPAGLPLTTTDPRNQVTRFAYLSTGDLARITEPSGLSTAYTYDPLGRKVTQTEITAAYPSGLTTTYTYDAMSRITSETLPRTTDAVTGAEHQRRTRTTYDADGNSLTVTVEDLLGGDEARTTTYEYDDSGRASRIIDPTNAETSFGYDRFGNRTWMVDPRGTRMEYAYTTRNAPAEERLAESNGSHTVMSSNAYDMAGRLVLTTDAMGRTVETVYNEDDTVQKKLLKAYVQPDGSERDVVLEEHTYDKAGFVARTVGADGEDVTTFTRDAVGRVLTQTQDPSGRAHRQTLTYDRGGNPLTVVRSGSPSNVPWLTSVQTQTTTYRYDTVGRRTAEELTNSDGSVRKSTFAYDDRGLLTSTVSPRGYEVGNSPAAFTTAFAHDELGRVIRTTEPQRAVEQGGGAPTTTAPVSLAGFNTFDEVTSTKSPDGRVTTSVFDRVGRVVEAAQPAYTAPGSSTAVTPKATYTYDQAGNLVKSTDPLGRESTSEYDRLGRVLKRTEPASGSSGTATWTYSYTPTGQVERVTDPTGAVSHATYDQFDRQVTSTRVERYPTTANFVTTYAYSAGGRLQSVRTPTGATTQYSYDTLGQLTQMTDAHGVKQTMGYDFVGNTVRSTDGSGRTTRSDYDLVGQLTATSDLDSLGTAVRTQRYTYDAEGNMLSSTNPDTRATTYTYDSAGQLVQQVEPVSATESMTTSFGYDVEGRNTRHTDGRANSTLMTYNSQGELESVIEPATAAHPAAADRTWTAAYDVAGQPVRLTAPGNVVRERTYDVAGRVTKETGNGAEVATRDRVMGYDAVGRIVSMSHPRATNTFTYNDAGQVLTSAGPSGASSFAYDEDGQLVQRDDASGQARFTYDRGRLTSLVDPVTGGTQTIGYYAGGEVMSVDYGQGRKRSYIYDPLGRLRTDVLKNGSSATVASVTYGYDAQDNVTSKDTTGFGASAQNVYGYDYASRLTSWDKDGVATLYTWDKSGNRTRSGDQVSTYDERNRLLSDGQATYEYTARGTLKARTQAGQRSDLTFDAFDRMISDNGRTYTYDAVGRLDDAAGTMMSYAGLGADPVAAGSKRFGRASGGELLSVADGTNTRVAITDLHGDVVGGFSPADATLGSLPDRSVYDPWGAKTSTAGLAYGVGFQGDWTDPASGKVNMGARWYEPGTGSFVSRDSASYAGGASILANKYTYAAGSPVTLDDPDGRWPSCGWCSKVTNAVASGWNTATRAVSTAWNATTSAVSSGLSRLYDYGRAAWNYTKAFVVKAASAAWNAVKRGAAWLYEKGKQAVSYVVDKVKAGYNWVKDRVSDGVAWAKQQAAEAARRVYQAKVRITQAAKAAVAFAVKHNPLPAIKAALAPVMNGVIAVTKAALALPAAVVAVTRDVVKAAAQTVQQVYNTAVAAAGQVVQAVSKAASAVSEFVQENKAAIAGVLTGLAVTAGCLAITAGAGSGACVVAGMAAGNAVLSAMSCPPGRSVAGCAARGAVVGAVAGVITVASGGTLGGLVIGGAVSSGAGTALDSALQGKGVDAREVISSAVIGAATAGVGAKLGPAAKRVFGGCGGKNSFTAATRVKMADGSTKAIKDVRLGDKVMATDARTGRTSGRLVTNLIRHAGVHAMVAITLVGGAGAVHATDGHPVYDATKQEYVDASLLRAGDQLRLDSGRTIEIAKVEAYRADLKAYNLTVDVDHTYYVKADASAIKVLVHNCGGAVAGHSSRCACAVGDAPRISPNPWGKLGSPAHRRVVSDVRADLESQGLRVEAEVEFSTPGGFKNKRYADLAAYDENGLVSIHQVGRQTKGGLPVMRESKAIWDIWSAMDDGVDIQFHRYN
ncbi:LamG-like jellyroll fold domain-containing protein [Knoellia sp. CPCC 206450]|uniref:LamG-like jellyroll fold domain-containing protein n=1 Tax=Knoellia tibetensis TaxID=3404798 RepID=UPI003B43C380